MSDKKAVVLEDQYNDRLIELAKNAKSMIEVNKAQAEFQNELGKTKEEQTEKWKELLGSLAKIEVLGKSLEDVKREIAERKITLATGAPAMRSRKDILFDVARYSLGVIKASKEGGNDPAYLKDVVESIQKAGPLASDTATGGSEFVPTTLAEEIFQLLEDEGIAMGQCTRLPMETMNQDVVDPGSVTLDWQSVLGSEGTAATDQKPTTAKSTLAADTLIATMGLTNQLLKTSNAQLVQVYTTRFIRRMTREFEKQILAGTGAPFTGITDASNVKEVVQGAGLAQPEEVTFDNIVDLIAKLSNEALRGARWKFHPTQLASVRKIKTGISSDNTSIFAAPGGDQPATIYGIPFDTSFEMLAATGSDQASKVHTVLGNLEHCLLGVVEDIRFDVSQDVAFRAYMAVLRSVMVGAILIPDGTAFGKITTGTA